MSEVLIDEQTGRVDGYEVAGRKGPLAPHSVLSEADDVRVGPDALVVGERSLNDG